MDTMHDIRDTIQCRFYAHRNIRTVRTLPEPHNSPHVEQLTTVRTLNSSKSTAGIIHMKNGRVSSSPLEDGVVGVDQVGDVPTIMCKAKILV